MIFRVPERAGTCSERYTDPAAQVIKGIYESIRDGDCKLANPMDYPPHYRPVNGEQFDFIVVGAGSAGSVVASRLSERREWKVLLLEAGGNPTKTSEVPAYCSYLQGTELDWKYKTNPTENNCLGMVNNTCNFPRGKVLGGSSTINYMLYVRGNRRDFDLWESDGNEGWGYEDVLPYFKKSEDMRAEEVISNADFTVYHNTSGYLTVDKFYQNKEIKYLKHVLEEGAKELGYPPNYDVNGKSQFGYVTSQGTLRDGRRCSTAKAFLIPASERKNLKISKYSLVTRILIKDQKAYGVEFIDRNGNTIRVTARLEVILSGGAINTPQLLMLSGIGPRRHLEELRIKVVQDLPVGHNLQDHMLSNTIVIALTNVSTNNVTEEESMTNFLLEKESSLSSENLFDQPLFYSTVGNNDYPNMQLYTFYYDKNSSNLRIVLKSFNFKEEIIEKYVEINRKYSMFIGQGSLLHPHGRGRITLNTIDPKKHPVITSGIFSDSRDLGTFIQTYDFWYRFVQTISLKSIGAKLYELEVPECSHLTYASKEFRVCALLHLTATTYHQSGTCRMGPATSRDSVVDSQLRVHGVERLRVIDASVMPYVVTGNTNAATIMIGEKGSDYIKQTWLRRKT